MLRPSVRGSQRLRELHRSAPCAPPGQRSAAGRPESPGAPRSRGGMGGGERGGKEEGVRTRPEGAHRPPRADVPFRKEYSRKKVTSHMP